MLSANQADARPARLRRTSAPAELTVETVSDWQSFLDLQPVWDRLVEEAGLDYPFVTHEWVREWWQSFGADKRLHILVAKAGAEPIAIAPLMLSRARMYGLKVRRLEFIYNVHTPRFDFIVARRAEECYRALWNCLVQQKAQWDVLELCQLTTSSRTVKELPHLAVSDGFLIGIWPATQSPYVPLRGSWEDYFAKSLRSHHRSNMRNRLKRLEQLGPLALEVISGGGQVSGALEDGLRIEAAAWKGEAGSAINCSPELSRFYRGVAERAAERGWLRLQFVNANGRRIAFAYSLCYRSKLYVLKIGYDPDFAPYSPCNVLTYMALRNAFEAGLAEYDILGVNDKWKLDWTKEVRPHCWMFIFSSGLRARLLHWAKFQVVPRLKRQRLYLAVRDGAMALLAVLAEKSHSLSSLGSAQLDPVESFASRKSGAGHETGRSHG